MLTKSLRCAPIYLVSILSSITIFSFIMLSSTTTFADVVDDVVITVPAACSFSDTTTDTTHSSNINNNQLKSDIGTTNFTVFCNDNGGFAIYAIGYSGDTYGNTNMLASTSGIPNIATGLATSGSTSAWAMKLIPVTGTYAPTIESDTNGSFANYHVVPSTYTKVATFNTTTDRTIGSKMQSTYRVFASATQPADTYTGKVRYTLVHPASEVPLQPQTPTARCINYFANASDAVGTMGCQSATDNASVTLLASNFSRTGYGFAGWSDTFDYKTNTNAHFYGPNETITAPVGTTANGLALYAVWVKSAGNLQSWSGCSSLTKANEATNILSESITALSDSRDNNTYAVARLADGNCWMIENLRLDDSAILTTANTNSPLNNGTTVTLKHNYTDTNTYNTLSPTSSVAYNATTAPDGWCTTDSAACFDQSRLRTDNTANRATYNSGATMNGDANIYGYGNYYNWYSATAGNGTYSFSTNNSSVSGDICPAGWSLPKGGRKANVANSDFWKLTRAIVGYDPANFANDYFYYTGSTEGTDASNKLRIYPNNFVYSGNVYGASVSRRSSGGLYWSSTTSSSISAYFLYFDSSYVYPGSNFGNKYTGRMARCVVAGS